MSIYEHKADKKSGDGLSLTEWNDLSNAVAGNSGLTLAIASKDKIGIGAGTPGSKLHIHDKSTTANTGTLIIGPTNGSNLRLGYNTSYSWIQSHGAKPLAINPIGNNVGIGTTDPKDKLDVKGNVSVSGDVKAAKFIGDGSGLTNLSVGLNGINLATNSGKVGVGTNNPQDQLEVGGFKTGDRYISITTAGGNKYKSGIKLLAFKKDFGYVIEHDETKPGLNFRFKNPYGADTNDSILFLKSNGNVGIGTTTPASKLHIQDKSTTANGGALIIGPTNGSNLRLGYNTKYSWIQSHGRKPLAINPVGNNVGIGTDSPSDLLECRGKFRLSTSNNYAQMYVISNKLVFKINKSTHGSNKGMAWDGDTNWDSYSDLSLKTDIAKEGNILDKLLKLDVKSYRWKDNPQRKDKMIGFIAQDVKPLFPALVGEIEDPETKQTTMTLKYASFGVLAVGAIKELKREIDNLQDEILSLKNSMMA
jgi:hypothetical protein